VPELLRAVDAWIDRYRELREQSFDALDGVLEDLERPERSIFRSHAGRKS